MKNETITAIAGLKVGHAHDEHARTGCSVVLLEPEADVACEARGGWPGTYDTHSIDVTKTFVRKHAIFLTGGDVFGFDVAIGIRRYLIERHLASLVGLGKLPGIVGANIYDQEFADISNVDYPELGYRACVDASSEPVMEGNVGAGIGATVGKLRGMRFACKGGCGTSIFQLPNGIVVGAIVITNSHGNIYENGKTISGTRRENGFVELEEILIANEKQAPTQSNTTIGVVATNTELSHEKLVKVSQMAHDGLAMSIRPVHTSLDGDTIFATTTATLHADDGKHSVVDVVGYGAACCVAKAVVRSVRAARSLKDVPGLNSVVS
ncbi:MAG: P1 family peptidase [Candidatus Bathyarchaeia archaeon]